MHPRTPLPAARIAGPVAALLLSLTAVSAQDLTRPVMKTASPPAAGFGPLVADPEGLTFGQKSFNLQDRLGGEVQALAFAPDGKRLATAGGLAAKRGFLKLWDADQGKELALVRQPRPIAAVAYSPDGKLLATGEADGVIQLRDPATGAVRRTFGRKGGPVSRLLFTPDGKHLLSTGKNSVLRVWDVADGKEAQGLIGKAPSSIGNFAFSRDGKVLVLDSPHGTVHVYDWPAAKERRNITTQGSGPGRSVALSPDGKTLAVTGQGQSIRLWNTESGKDMTPRAAPAKKGKVGGPQPPPSVPVGGIFAVAYTPDGKSLIASTYNALILLDAKSLKQQASFGNEPAFPVAQPAFSTVPSAPPRPSTVRLLASSADGMRVAAATGVEERAVLWDLKARHRVADLHSISPANRKQQPVVALAASRDGKLVALAQDNHTIALREVASGELRSVLRGHNDKITCLAFAPDGRTLASGSADNTVRLWDCGSGQERLTFKGHGNWVYAVVFSPDGKTVASGGYDRNVKLWDANTGAERATLRGHKAAVRALAFAPDGKLLASGSSDHTLKVWDVTTRQERPALRGGQKAAIRALAFSADGKLLAAAGADGLTNVWDVGSGQLRDTLAGNGGEPRALAFAPRGRRLGVALDDAVFAWSLSGKRQKKLMSPDALFFSRRFLAQDAPRGDHLNGHTDNVTGLAFGPDGRELITAGYDRGVRVWSATEVPVRLLKGHTGPVHAAIFAPDGKHVLTCSAEPNGGKTVRLWDFAAGKELRRYGDAGEPTIALAFAPDGRRFAAGSLRGAVRLYDVNATALPDASKLHGGSVRCLAFSPDGKRVVSGGDDRTVCVWDPATGQRVVCKGHTDVVRTVAFAPDGSRVISGGRDGTLRLWDARTGKQLRVITCDTVIETAIQQPPTKAFPGGTKPGHVTLGVESVQFLPGGQRVVCAEGQNLAVRDLQSGKRLRRITGHTGRIDHIALLPGGRVAVTASQDGTARYWDLETGRQLAQILAFTLPPPPAPRPGGPYYPPAMPAPPAASSAVDEAVVEEKAAEPPQSPPPEEPKKIEKGVKEKRGTAKKVEKKSQGEVKEVEVKRAPAPTQPPALQPPLSPSAQPQQQNPVWAWTVCVSPDGKHLLTTGASVMNGTPANPEHPACVVRVWRVPEAVRARVGKP